MPGSAIGEIGAPLRADGEGVMRRGFMVVAAGAVLAVCSAVPAGASAGWMVQPTPNPPGVQDSYLAGVTCTPAAECMAVGGYYQTSTGDEVTLAEFFNGSTWAIVPTPNVGSDSELAGVACASATSCIAVGSSGGGSAPLVEDWNGSTWTIQAVPGAGALNVIKCFGSASCVAVGTGSGSLPLIESWNGTKWTVQATPAASPGQLYGVSCVTPDELLRSRDVTASTSHSAFGCRAARRARTTGRAWPRAVPRRLARCSSTGTGRSGQRRPARLFLSWTASHPMTLCCPASDASGLIAPLWATSTTPEARRRNLAPGPR